MMGSSLFVPWSDSAEPPRRRRRRRETTFAVFAVWVATASLRVSVSRGACSPAGRGSPKLKRGGTTYVCLVLAKSLDWSDPTTEQRYVRAAFELKVDEYAQVRLANAWSPDLQRKLNSSEVALSAQSEDLVSFQKRWRTALDGGTKAVTFPFLSLVVKVENGEVKQLIWDDGCYDCDGVDCVHNAFDYDGSDYKHAEKQCFVDDADCASDDARGGKVAALCDLRVFVSWTGTDKHGRALLSQQFRFSRFEPISVEKYVQDLRKDDEVSVTITAASSSSSS